MFDRKKFKQFAKIQLKNRWTVPVLMTLISGAVLLLLQTTSIINFMRNESMEIITSGAPSSWEIIESYEAPVSSGFLDIAAQLCAYIFLIAQIHVYLIMSRKPDPVSLTDFFAGFNLWRRAILNGIWVVIWTSLWSMLFVIPGIVKSIAYSQTYFIITEYPNISVRKAMRISIAMTHGHKTELFIMYLSFIGWAILASLSFGIGLLWLGPYMSMTQVNAYHWLLKQAIETNTISKEDLGLAPEQQI